MNCPDPSGESPLESKFEYKPLRNEPVAAARGAISQRQWAYSVQALSGWQYAYNNISLPVVHMGFVYLGSTTTGFYKRRSYTRHALPAQVNGRVIQIRKDLHAFSIIATQIFLAKHSGLMRSTSTKEMRLGRCSSATNEGCIPRRNRSSHMTW